MKFFQDNPFLSGLLIAAVLVLGGGGFFVYQGVEQAGLAREDYEGKVRQLHQLQNAVPYPNAENLKKIEAGAEEIRGALKALREEIGKSQPEPVEGVTPEQFQDDLRKAVLRVQAKAAEFEVSLGEDFYLGFNRYQTALPRSEATGELTRQLGVIENLFNSLIETRVSSISLERQVLPIEDGASAKKDDNAPEKTPLLVRESLNLKLSGEQARMRQAFNVILDLPQFVIIRALSVSNSELGGPARETNAEALKQASGRGTDAIDSLFGDPSGAPGAKAESLPIILGRETLSATLRLELLDFRGFKIEG